MNEDNIIDGGRTRGAKPTGSYQEPGDDEVSPNCPDLVYMNISLTTVIGSSRSR